MCRASEGSESRLTHAMILPAPAIPPDCVETTYASRPLSLTAWELPPHKPGAAAATPPRPWKPLPQRRNRLRRQPAKPAVPRRGVEVGACAIAVNRFGAIPYKHRFAQAISAEAASASAIPLRSANPRDADNPGRDPVANGVQGRNLP